MHIWQHNKKLNTTELSPTTNDTHITECHIKTGIENSDNVTLKIFPGTKGHNTAIDEIYIIPKKQ